MTTRRLRPSRSERPTGVPSASPPASSRSCGGELPVRLRAWDGSEAGPVDAPLVVLSSPDALRRLLWRPGELGAAQAYVTGEIDVDGDLDDGARRTCCGRSRGRAGCPGSRPRPAALARAAYRACVGALGPACRRRPASQARLRGRLHSQAARPVGDQPPLRPLQRLLRADPRRVDGLLLRLLDVGRPVVHARPTRSATSSTWSAASSASSRASTMLDVGCGWGSLSLHAAEHFGAQVTGVTIAAEQKAFIDARIRRARARRTASRSGCRTTATSTGTYDAVASIEMGEHVGEGNYPTYADVLRRVGQARRPGAGPADVADAAGTPAAARSSSPSSRPTCTCGRSARPSRCLEDGGPRGARRARAARALRAHRGGWYEHVRGQPTIALVALVGRGGRPGLAALPRRRRHGLPRRADGRRPDPSPCARALPLDTPGGAHVVILLSVVVSLAVAAAAMTATALVARAGRAGLGRRRDLGARASSLIALVALRRRRRRPAGVPLAAGWRWWRCGACRLSWHILSASWRHPARTRATPARWLRRRRLRGCAVRKVFVVQGAGGLVRLAAAAGRPASSSVATSVLAGLGRGRAVGWSASCSRRSATPSSRRTRRDPTGAR